MADYWRFPDRGAPVSVHSKRPRADYDDLPPGHAYLSRDEPRYDDREGRFSWRESEPLGMAPDGIRNMPSYGSGGIAGSDIPGLNNAPFMGMTGMPNLGISSLNDPSLNSQGGRMMGNMDPGIVKPGSMALNGGRLDYLPGQDTQSGGPTGLGLVPPDATSTLYVEGVPSDCSRREAAHIFRPFVGFKEVRLVRKDAKRPGGDQFVLCFVDFTDPKCASIALEALQGYKFDETDRNSETLRLQYSRFPGSRPGPRDSFRGVRDRDNFPHNRPFRH